MTPPQAAGNQIRPALRGIEYFEKARDGIPLLKMALDCEVQGHQEGGDHLEGGHHPDTTKPGFDSGLFLRPQGDSNPCYKIENLES